MSNSRSDDVILAAARLTDYSPRVNHAYLCSSDASQMHSAAPRYYRARHRCDHIRLRRLDQQVVMVRHQHLVVYPPAGSLAHLAQCGHKAVPIPIIAHHQLLPVTPISQVISCTQKLYSRCFRMYSIKSLYISGSMLLPVWILLWFNLLPAPPSSKMRRASSKL